MILQDWLSAFRSPFRSGSRRKFSRISHRRRKTAVRQIASIQSLEERQMLSGTNEPPQFDDGGMGYYWSIAEDASIGTVVGTVAATDPEGDSITYALTSGSETPLR